MFSFIYQYLVECHVLLVELFTRLEVLIYLVLSARILLTPSILVDASAF